MPLTPATNQAVCKLSKRVRSSVPYVSQWHAARVRLASRLQAAYYDAEIVLNGLPSVHRACPYSTKMPTLSGERRSFLTSHDFQLHLLRNKNCKLFIVYTIHKHHSPPPLWHTYRFCHYWLSSASTCRLLLEQARVLNRK